MPQWPRTGTSHPPRPAVLLTPLRVFVLVLALVRVLCLCCACTCAVPAPVLWLWLWLCCGCGCAGIVVRVVSHILFCFRGAPGQGRLLRVRGHAQRIRRATAERGRERPHKLRWENQNLQLLPITGRYD